MTPYQRILHAANQGKGLLLSAEDVRQLVAYYVIQPIENVDDACPGEGRCHGCVVWCDVCGDVDETCDFADCDIHIPRRENSFTSPFTVSDDEAQKVLHALVESGVI